MSSASLLRDIQRVREITRQSSLRHEIPPDRVEFAESVGFKPDEWQEEVLTSTHPRKILCCGRQTGKTTVAALLVIHKALTQPGSTILIVGPAEKQAKLLFSKVSSLYKRVGYPLPAHSERKTGLELANGSVIEALPAVERTTRGYSIDLLVADEAAGIPEHDFMAIEAGLLATRGERLYLSTPRGKRGFFYETWFSEADWHRVMITVDDIDRITEEDLEPFRHWPQEFFNQEFYCHWLDTEGGLFSHDDIQAALALGEDVEPLQLEDDEW